MPPEDISLVLLTLLEHFGAPFLCSFLEINQWLDDTLAVLLDWIKLS